MSYLDVLPPSYLPFTSTTWYLRTSQYFHTTFVPNTCPRFVYARIIQLGFQFPPRFAGCVPAVPCSLPRQQSSAIVRGLGQFSTDSIESEVSKHQNDQFQFSCVLAHMVSIKVHKKGFAIRRTSRYFQVPPGTLQVPLHFPLRRLRYLYSNVIEAQLHFDNRSLNFR